jgi:hypothetical protein
MSVLRRDNGVPFAIPSEKCTCDTAKLDATCKAVYTQRTPWMLDKDGNKLFWVDSFGWRERVPGECDDCYTRFDEGRKAAAKAEPYDEFY